MFDVVFDADFADLYARGCLLVRLGSADRWRAVSYACVPALHVVRLALEVDAAKQVDVLRVNILISIT